MDYICGLKRTFDFKCLSEVKSKQMAKHDD